MDILSLIIGGIGAFMTGYIIQNNKLKEGLTSALLKSFNKESIKKIPLKEHKVFSYFRGYQNQLGLLMFNSEVKSVFFQVYIKILFTEVEKSVQEILKSKDLSDSFDSVVSIKIEEALNRTSDRVKEVFIIPDNVRAKFNQWRLVIRHSFKTSVDFLLNDDLMDNCYVKQYRLLDSIANFLNFVMNTGASTFSSLNGAFDKLKVSDIFTSRETMDQMIKESHVVFLTDISIQ